MPITAKKVLGRAVGADLDCLITTVVAVYASITLKPIFAQANLKTFVYSSLQNVSAERNGYRLTQPGAGEDPREGAVAAESRLNIGNIKEGKETTLRNA